MVSKTMFFSLDSKWRGCDWRSYKLCQCSWGGSCWCS